MSCFIIAGHYYQNNCDKLVLARRYLVDVLHVDKAQVAAIQKSDLLVFFHDKLGMDAFQSRQLLWDAYQPYSLWYLFGAIGVGSLCAFFSTTTSFPLRRKTPSMPSTRVETFG